MATLTVERHGADYRIVAPNEQVVWSSWACEPQPPQWVMYQGTIHWRQADGTYKPELSRAAP